MSSPVIPHRPVGVDTAELLTECCAQLRQGRRAASSRLLETLLERLASLLAEQPTCLTPALQAGVARALDHQRQGDLIALADEIEYVVFPPLIGSLSDRER